jgi:hypothetical protein
MQTPKPSMRLFWEEPFRLFFPVGLTLGIVGVSLWPLYYAGLITLYPATAHARLMIEGATTEADKTIVEAIFEPLLHVLRNALDHGLESPDERAQLGKPTLTLARAAADAKVAAAAAS